MNNSVTKNSNINSNLVYDIYRKWTLSINTRNQLDKYYVLYYSPKFFLAQYTDNKYYIEREGIRYDIQLLENIADIEQAKQVRLSFRHYHKADMTIAVVLVNFKY